MTTKAAAADAAIAIIADRARAGLPTTADDVRVAFSEAGVRDKQTGGIFRRAERHGIVHRDPDWNPKKTRDRIRWLPGPAPADETADEPTAAAARPVQVGANDMLQVPVRRGTSGRFVKRHIAEQPAIPAFPIDEVL